MDGSIVNQEDYAAGYYYTSHENNYFVLNLGIPRHINKVEVLWYNSKLYGESWILEYYDGVNWHFFRKENNWAPEPGNSLYTYIISHKVRATKIRFTLLHGHGQDRIVMRRFSLY